jgi:aminopeptidase N
MQTYQRLWSQESHKMDAKAYGYRKLRNVCLSLMMKANEEESLAVCQEQFAKAKTMTDQLASFAFLVNGSDRKVMESASERFYQQWATNELVMDKWFAVLATRHASDTILHVRSLLNHSHFSIKNPNKVRALIGAFCMNNPRNFHAIDGSGYRFLGEILVQLDKINPQVAARLATPFTRWKRYDKPRQGLMKKELMQLSTLALSPDLQEIVSKCLKE